MLKDRGRKGGSSRVGKGLWLFTLGSLYLVSRAALFDLGKSDQAGNALALGFAVLADVLLWLLIAAFAYWSLRRSSGFLSVGTVIALLAVAAIGSVTAVCMIGDAAWLKVPAALLPIPAMALFLGPSGSTFPAEPGYARRLTRLIGAIVLVLAAVPIGAFAISFNEVPEREAVRNAVFARAEAERADRIAAFEEDKRERFKALGPSSRLDDFLEFLPTSEEQAADALDGARQSTSRQADAIRLLKEGHILDLDQLHRVNLHADERLCAAYRDALVGSLRPGSLPSTGMAAHPLDYEPHLPNLVWLKANGCKIEKTAQLLASMLRARAGQTSAPDFLAELDKLSR